MKRSCPLIAKREEQRLKTWWLATALSILFLMILLWLLTARINRIIRFHAFEHQPTHSQSLPSTPTIPCTTTMIQEISATVPARVAFQKLSIDQKAINIEGKTQDPHAWASWIDTLEKFPWISHVDIEHLTHKKQSNNEYSFLINLYF